MKCEICEKEFKTIRGLAIHLSTIHKNISNEEYYRNFLMKTNENNICEMYGKLDLCKKYTKFYSLAYGFLNYCSIQCASKCDKVKNKKKQTSLKNWGTDHPFQSQEVRGKYKNTCIKKIGVDNFFKLDKTKDKIKNTNLKKYGVEHIGKSKEIKKKIKKTNLEKRGVEYVFQDKIVQEKIKKTNLEKRGFKNPGESKEIKEKIKKTNLKRRGVEYVFQDKSVREKGIQTCLEKWNVENPSQSIEIQEKSKQTNLTKFGVEYPFQSKIIKNKIKIKKHNKFLKKFYYHLNSLNLELVDKNYIHETYKHTWKCLKCKEIFKQIWNNIQQGYLCPKCFPRNGPSKSEKEIYEFICNLIGSNKVKHNCWNLIKNLKTNYSFEIDIYIPSLKIAFEYNGLYWHSDLILNNHNYHLNKTNLCVDKKIQLIHIFEDEWIFKKEIVKSKIKQILNINNLKRILLRKCNIREIDLKTKNEFLNKFHIQGKDSSKINLGAFYNNELISVMTFKNKTILKDEKIWELNRFCINSNFHIPRIVEKLLSYFKKNYNWKQIFSYDDRRWSQGDLYYKLGFELDDIIKPDYWFIKDLKRIHCFNLKEISNKPENYSRIWDCGNLKMSIKNTE